MTTAIMASRKTGSNIAAARACNGRRDKNVACRHSRQKFQECYTTCVTFSGFHNIFFNHFLDVVALFSYLLAALDDAAIDGKKGQFPFWVALNLLNNYFFFAGQAVFLEKPNK